MTDVTTVKSADSLEIRVQIKKGFWPRGGHGSSLPPPKIDIVTIFTLFPFHERQVRPLMVHVYGSSCTSYIRSVHGRIVPTAQNNTYYKTTLTLYYRVCYAFMGTCPRVVWTVIVRQFFFFFSWFQEPVHIS